MCSIFGIISQSEIPVEIINQTPELLNYTSNRGPDDQNSIIINNRVYLGSNRLSIIDLTSQGRMPFKSLNGNFWICFNGEIYNYRDLRDQLIKKGLVFLSTSDTEVIINAYIYWGEKFIERLNGIFAFIIFDQEKNLIVTGRDRFGAKPLYYYRFDDCIVYSSDFIVIRNLIDPSQRKIDPEALTAYMQCRFVPGERTILKNVFKLKPAEIKIWQINDLSSKSCQFWHPKFSPDLFQQTTFDQKLNEAIRYTSTADINPTLLLSGGLDSAAIAATLYNQGHRHLETYTFTFTNPDTFSDPDQPCYQITTPNIDEHLYAQMVSQKFEFSNQVITVDPDIRIEDFIAMQKLLGEPIASTNSLSNFLFARSLKGKTKLALAGTGSDELLGGYLNLYFKTNEQKLGTFDNPNIFLQAFSNFDNKEYCPPSDYIHPDLVQTNYLKKYLTDTMDIFPAEKYPNELINQLAFFEIAFALPGWELDQADRLFMNQAIELRPAFLENNFVDYTLTISSKHKYNKQLLKEAMKKYLPKKITCRPKYPGMGTPRSAYSHRWFKTAMDYLFSEPHNIWNKEKILRLIKKPIFQIDFDLVYRLLYLQIWLKYILY